jgi:hypothetical protein
MKERNVAASVRARLLNRARDTKQDFSLVLTRDANERLLYRISISTHADQFLRKGALSQFAKISIFRTSNACCAPGAAPSPIFKH